MDQLRRETQPPAGMLPSPVPQYWNPDTEQYERVLGANGAPRAILYGPNGQPISSENALPVTLTGVIAETFGPYALRGSRYGFTYPVTEFGIVNTGEMALVVEIGASEIRVPPGSAFHGRFPQFSQVKVWQELLVYDMWGINPMTVEDRSGNGFNATGVGGLSYGSGLTGNSWRSVRSDGTGYYDVDPRAKVVGKAALRCQCVVRYDEDAQFSEFNSLVSHYRGPGGTVGWYVLYHYVASTNVSQFVTRFVNSSGTTPWVSVDVTTDVRGLTFRLDAEFQGDSDSLRVYDVAGNLVGQVSTTRDFGVINPDDQLNPIRLLASNADSANEYSAAAMESVRILVQPDPNSFFAYGMR